MINIPITYMNIVYILHYNSRFRLYYIFVLCVIIYYNTYSYSNTKADTFVFLVTLLFSTFMLVLSEGYLSVLLIRIASLTFC